MRPLDVMIISQMLAEYRAGTHSDPLLSLRPLDYSVPLCCCVVYLNSFTTAGKQASQPQQRDRASVQSSSGDLEIQELV